MESRKAKLWLFSLLFLLSFFLSFLFLYRLGIMGGKPVPWYILPLCLGFCVLLRKNYGSIHRFLWRQNDCRGNSLLWVTENWDPPGSWMRAPLFISLICFRISFVNLLLSGLLLILLAFRNNEKTWFVRIITFKYVRMTSLPYSYATWCKETPSRYDVIICINNMWWNIYVLL